MTHFSHNLKAKRLEKGWTQTEAARRLKTHVRNYRNYESGYTEPNLKTIQQIMKVFSVDDFPSFLAIKLNECQFS